MAVAVVAALGSVSHLDGTAVPSEGLDPRPLAVEEMPVASPISAPDPPELTLAGFAYESIAGELPDTSPDEVLYTQQSVLDPSWATVRFPAPERSGEERYHALFLRRQGETTGRRSGRSLSGTRTSRRT